MDVFSFIATLFTAVVSAGVTLTVCLINNSAQSKKTQASFDKAIAIIEYRINELSARVEKHNNVVERTYALEKDVAVLKNRESVSENRLKDLENDGK